MQLNGDTESLYPELLKRYSEQDLNRAKAVEASRLKETVSAINPSLKDELAPGYNNLLDMYAGALRQQAAMSPEEKASDIALGSLGEMGITRKTGGKGIIESVDEDVLKRLDKGDTTTVTKIGPSGASKEYLQDRLIKEAFPEYAHMDNFMFGGNEKIPLTGNLENALKQASDSDIQNIKVHWNDNGTNKELGIFKTSDLKEVLDKMKAINK